MGRPFSLLEIVVGVVVLSLSWLRHRRTGCIGILHMHVSLGLLLTVVYPNVPHLLNHHRGSVRWLLQHWLVSIGVVNDFVALTNTVAVCCRDHLRLFTVAAVDIVPVFCCHHLISLLRGFSDDTVELLLSLPLVAGHLLYHGCIVEHVRRNLERLSHLFEEICGDLDRDIGGKIRALRRELVSDPLWQLLEVVSALVALVCEDHLPVVVLGAENTADALARLPHCIERQEVLVTDLVVFLEELHASSQVPTQRVLERNAKDYDASAIVSSEVNTLGDFTSSDREKYGTSAIVTGLLVIFERQNCFQVVLSLNENEFVLEHALQDAHFIPLDNHVLHVLVAREEADHAVGDYPAELDQ